MQKLLLLFFLFSLVLSNSNLLKETKYCEVNNQKIQDKAKSLKKSSTLETAKNIYHFVQFEIAYEAYANTKKGALKTLNARKGNCADQAHLLVALFRAAGIPARYVHGIGHYWTQCYVNNRYYDCDPTHKTKHIFGKRANDGKNARIQYLYELKY